MYYRLNESHSFNPKTASNIAAVQRITDYLAGGKVASEDELRSVLTGISNPHGDVVKWLARRSRKVILPVSGGQTGVDGDTHNQPQRIQAPAPPRKPATSTIGSIWCNPNNVDLYAPLIYRIEIWADDGMHYDYVGKARDASRLKEYDRNIKKIEDQRERGITQKYRAVHFALYQALQKGWRLNCYPLENCTVDQLNTRERQLIAEYPCNLNEGKGWRVADINSLSVAALIR